MSELHLQKIAEKYFDATVELAQNLVRIPSPSGEEGKLAQYVKKMLEQLSFDETTVDPAGNILGRMKGSGNGASVMLNCHLDTVDPGELSFWPHDPYAGVVTGGALWGLGASDTKGAFACQLMAAAALKKEGLLPAGDIWVSGVVQEETTALGSRYLARQIPFDTVILGEATDNRLNVGHRGRMLFELRFTGKSTHASAPERGANPHYAAARFLLQLESLAMTEDPFWGRSSAAPTLYTTDQTSSNVTPEEAVVFVDWRNIPGETEKSVADRLASLAAGCTIPGVQSHIALTMVDAVSYTGYRATLTAGEPSFSTPVDDAAVQTAHQALNQALGYTVPIGMCLFATDGGHYRAAGSKVLIFAPAEEKYCHTKMDQLSLVKMKQALAGNMALLLALASSKTAAR